MEKKKRNEKRGKNWEKERFIKINFVGNYRQDNARRLFFENFAKLKGFDPRKPENWYSLQKEHVLPFKVS